MSRSHRTHRQWCAILVVIASMAGTASGTAQTMPPQGPSAPGPDHDLARRHLTAARNLLSDVTELPAAAQLTGDTRLQVQRLIGDFNELIATGSNWRESYAKVESGLESLLSQPASPAGADSSGTSGAGSLDATIRGKLVEFSSQLDRFEAAASGKEPAGRAPAQPAQQARAMPQELVHIEAIEVILDAQARAQKAATVAAGGAITSSQTASGSTRTTITNPDVTLGADQLEQIKAHLTELRRLLERK
jgi:hypothetical protein